MQDFSDIAIERIPGIGYYVEMRKPVPNCPRCDSEHIDREENEAHCRHCEQEFEAFDVVGKRLDDWAAVLRHLQNL